MVGPGCGCSPCRIIHTLGLRRFLSSSNFPPFRFIAGIFHCLNQTLLLIQFQGKAKELKFNVPLHRAGGGRERGRHTQVVKYQPSVATWKGMLMDGMLMAIESMLNQLNKNGSIPTPSETQQANPSSPHMLSLLRLPPSPPTKFPFLSRFFSPSHGWLPPLLLYSCPHRIYIHYCCEQHKRRYWPHGYTMWASKSSTCNYTGIGWSNLSAEDRGRTQPPQFILHLWLAQFLR